MLMTLQQLLAALCNVLVDPFRKNLKSINDLSNEFSRLLWLNVSLGLRAQEILSHTGVAPFCLLRRPGKCQQAAGLRQQARFPVAASRNDVVPVPQKEYRGPALYGSRPDSSATPGHAVS